MLRVVNDALMLMYGIRSNNEIVAHPRNNVGLDEQYALVKTRRNDRGTERTFDFAIGEREGNGVRGVGVDAGMLGEVGRCARDGGTCVNEEANASFFLT